MNETLRTWWSRITQWLSKFSSAQKRNISIAGIAAVVCISVILWMLLRPHYVTVMAGLDNKSLGQAENVLQQLKIPDQIQGSSILVPSSQADKARIQLAMAGLPKQGYIGYGNIPMSFGTTSDQFNIEVLDALQQSLNETIQSIDGIESAQVHIVPPDQQLFVSSDSKNTAKASVFVQLGTGVQLSSAQVAGIQQLVSHSVKGLNASDVSVIDQNGVSLSSNAGADTGTASASTEIAMRTQMEQKLTAELTAGLNNIVGVGNAVVMVHANVTFNKVESQSHSYQTPQGQTTGPPSSTQVTRKTSTVSSGAAAGGPAGQAGTNPNLPSYAGAGTSNGGSSNTSETDTTTNYNTSYTDTHTVNDPIQINGYSVGVFLNADDKSVTPAVENNIKSFVAKAIGTTASSAVNNDITVSTVPFHRGVTSSGQGFSKFANWGMLAAAIGAGVVVLGGGWLVVRARRRRGADRMIEGMPITLEDTLDALPVSESERMKEELAKLADRRPAEFVSLLRSWLAND